MPGNLASPASPAYHTGGLPACAGTVPWQTAVPREKPYKRERDAGLLLQGLAGSTYPFWGTQKLARDW